MFYYSRWMELPLGTRNTIAGYLGITKKASIEVVDNRVVRDGYALKDIEAVMSVPNLQKFLTSDENEFEVLWNILVNKAEGRVVNVNIDTTVPIAALVTSEPPKMTDEEVKLEMDKGKRMLMMSFPKKKGGRPKGSKNKSSKL